ncbi:paired immunoglobulin-like type 2 receptor alpha [Rhineura floridana]|uniref:paired immunoglobulin-like type 2 receptor alpha n=1 Tax=Rhineura floridana TaxID=261503 RepID=UPI002AC8835D|nr:paired immunoglobulin-like type 2 receptor alpha [Rhineura floridana]
MLSEDPETHAASGPKEMLPQGVPVLLLLALPLTGESVVPSKLEHSHPKPAPAKSQEASPTCSPGPQDCGTFCTPYKIWQPCHLSARPKGSITLLCTFNYTWQANQTASVYWRFGNFHGGFLFNHTENNTHQNYTGRVSLVGDPSKGHASIRIDNLAPSDSSIYFCRLSLWTLYDGLQQWQAISGTNLTVTGDPVLQQADRSLLGPVAGTVLPVAVIALGLVIFLTWRKGCSWKCRQTRGSPAQSKGKQEGEYEEVDFEGGKSPQRAAPQLPSGPPGEPGILYAALTLSDAELKKPPLKMPEEGRDEQTTYAVLHH